MHDMGHRSANCSHSRTFDPTMCGFSNHAGCTPLDGCGSPLIFPFLVSFTILVSFVFLNLFISVILDGFSTASADRKDLIRTEDFGRFAQVSDSPFCSIYPVVHAFCT
jgi:voltage-dependent calcium channel L type alpha-1D